MATRICTARSGRSIPNVVTLGSAEDAIAEAAAFAREADLDDDS